MSWAWWDCPLTWLTNYRPSVLLHCWLGHLTRKTVSKMTYNVSSGTLNSTIPYLCLIHTGILTTLENLFDARGREWCLRQASKSVFSLVWPWPLTSWATQLMFHGRDPPTTCVDIGSSVLKTSCSLVWWQPVWESDKVERTFDIRATKITRFRQSRPSEHVQLWRQCRPRRTVEFDSVASGYGRATESKLHEY